MDMLAMVSTLPCDCEMVQRSIRTCAYEALNVRKILHESFSVRGSPSVARQDA